MVNNKKIDTIEINRLFYFLDGLRVSGYRIDPRQYIALSDLLMALVARGESLDDLSLKTLIAPLICTTLAEQQDFYQRFDSWFIRLPPVKQVSLEGKSGVQPKARKWKFPTISRTVLVWILALIATLTTLYFWLVTTSGNTGIQIDNNNNILYYGVFAILLSIVSRWLWILYQKNQYITRELANQEPVYTKLSVKAYIQEIMPIMQYKPIVSALRKRIQVPSSEVDVNLTIETALNHNSWMEIIYRQQQVTPEYVVLIDRKSRIDQQARFVQEVLTRLAADGVWLHQYEFSGDPRICFPLDRKDSPLQLKKLQAQHPDARLLIFSGMNELISPLTGFLQDWLATLSYWKNRAILTPDKINQVLLEELHSHDFVVLPINFDGLTSLVRAFERNNTPFPTTMEPNLPAQLIERPLRWAGREAPPEADIKTIVHDLKEYLGENGFYWLCATAVYPELRWELTLHLGSKLKDDFGQSLINLDILLRLARLPWFRYGYMPDWMRLALIQGFKPEQEIQTRVILSELLATAFKNDGLDSLFVHYAKNSISMADSYQRIVKGLLKNSQPDSVNKDYIFAKFIVKKTNKKLAVLLPKFPQKTPKDRTSQNAVLPQAPSFLKPESKRKNINATILSKDPFPKVPPFYMPPPRPLRKKAVDVRGMLSLITMLISLAALTLSMGGFAKFVIDVFDEGIANSLDGLLVKIVVLGIIFFFGWFIGLVSIQLFGNLIYSIIITIYAWVCLLAVCGLYLMVIQKLYMQQYDSLHFWAYLLMLLGGLFVLNCLHLMVEDHDLRPFAIPILIISVFQLVAILIRYVFVANPNGWMVFGDFSVFGVMISISALMLAHIGILSPLRDWVNGLFVSNQNSKKQKV